MPEWNPKWVAFLAERGLTTEEADALNEDERIKLNAEFISFNVRKMSYERRKRFFQ